MRKRELALMMLGILIVQNISFSVDVFAVTAENSAVGIQSAVNLEDFSEATLPTVHSTPAEISDSSESSPLSATTIEPTTSTIQSTEENEPSTTNESQVNEKSAARSSELKSTTQAETLITSASLLDASGNEYSQTTTNRILNMSPVKLSLEFSTAGFICEAGRSYEVGLPANLNYSDESGDITEIGATWTVDANQKVLKLQFNQRVSETNFHVTVATNITTTSEPLLTVTMPGKTAKTYTFDLYENVEPIKYVERSYNYGINGEIFYNLDRTLSGNQTLEITTKELADASFNRKDEDLAVASYSVDVKGRILADTKTILTKGTDYTITADRFNQTSVSIANMDQQKAYGISIKRTVYLENLSDVQYSFTQKYPTTKVGTIDLKQKGNVAFVAKTSSNQKEIVRRNVETQSYVSKASKGNYSLVIYNNLTATKAGQQIILESKNGQTFSEYNFTAQNEADQTVPVTDYFTVENKNNQLILTATKDSVLKLTLANLKVNLNHKDFVLTLATPAIKNKQAFELILDEYVETIALLHAENSEVAWGNLSEPSNAGNTAAVSIIGSEAAPVKNVTIKVKHPSYLSLRIPKEIQENYKLNQHYTVTPTLDGTTIRFTVPVQHELNFPLNFNYVPDGLVKQESIPIDTIPVTITAAEQETVTGEVVTNQKSDSERVLQDSGNKFLLNARNDSFDSLKVKITVPEGINVLVDIYDVSNSEVTDFGPQNWHQPQHLTKLISPGSPDYPTIHYDAQNKTYVYDFGQTNKRYILVFKNANGWMDTRTIFVHGSTAEPLNENQELEATIILPNNNGNILTATQVVHENYKNVTENSVTTKNVNDSTNKIPNPTFEITVGKDLKAEVDVQSIVVDNIPKSAYSIEKLTNGGAKIVFKNYTLTENITFHYRLISEEPGDVFTKIKLGAPVLKETLIGRRTINTQKVHLDFSESEAAGVVFLANAKFKVFEENEEEQQPLADVAFELTDPVSNEVLSFTSNDNGEAQQASMLTGDYVLRVTAIPEGYMIADEYRSGKTIKVVKGENTFEIPLKKKEDKTSITVQDSTLHVGDSWEPKANFVSGTDQEGQPITFDQIAVTGTVDTSTIGDYEIVYKNNTKEATAIVHVVANQTSLVVKDSTIYVGDSWQKADNFVAATDPDGNALALDAIQVSGTVNSAKVGVYEVTYTLGTQTQVAKITVIADQTSVTAKDSSIYVGSAWQPEDNFVAATDRDGKSVPFEEITIIGEVDTHSVGDYQVHYHNGTQEATATIHVVADQETVVVKDSTLYIGDQWTAADNFLQATDRQGNAISLEEITVTGTVDMNKPGVYEVTYHYGKVTTTAKITVKADLSSITVVDSTIYVGDEWNPEDNFVSATDRDGNDIEFDQVTVEGDVKTTAAGNYQVVYTAQTQTTNNQKTKKALTSSAPKKAQQITAVAQVNVLNKPTTVKQDSTTPPTMTQTSVLKKQQTKKGSNQAHQLPKTGTTKVIYISIIGSLIWLILLIGVLYKQKRPG